MTWPFFGVGVALGVALGAVRCAGTRRRRRRAFLWRVAWPEGAEASPPWPLAHEAWPLAAVVSSGELAELPRCLLEVDDLLVSAKVRKNIRNPRFCVFSLEKLGRCIFFVFSPAWCPAFGRSAHVRKPRPARQPLRFRPPPARSPLHRAASPPRAPVARPGGPDRRFTGIDPGSSSKTHSFFCGS
jgi:hypothetical protein